MGSLWCRRPVLRAAGAQDDMPAMGDVTEMPADALPAVSVADVTGIKPVDAEPGLSDAVVHMVTDVMPVGARPREVKDSDVTDPASRCTGAPPAAPAADVTECKPAGAEPGLFVDAPPEVSDADVAEFKPAGAETELSDAVLRGLCDGVHEVVQRDVDEGPHDPAVAHRRGGHQCTCVFYVAYANGT